MYAVIDTNVIIAALLSHHDDSATVRVISAIASHKIIPLYHAEILAEYEEVLHRSKFSIPDEDIHDIITMIKQFGLFAEPSPTNEILPDMDDLIFYEVMMAKRNANAHLITGNKRHYPARPYIVSPAEMLTLIDIP